MLKVGDKVRVKVGRGYMDGEIVKIEGENVTIKTKNGKEVARKAKNLQKL